VTININPELGKQQMHALTFDSAHHISPEVDQAGESSVLFLKTLADQEEIEGDAKLGTANALERTEIENLK